MNVYIYNNITNLPLNKGKCTMAVLKFHYYSKTILERRSSYTIYNQEIFTSPSYRSTYVCPNTPGYPVIPYLNLPVTIPTETFQPTSLGRTSD